MLLLLAFVGSQFPKAFGICVLYERVVVLHQHTRRVAQLHCDASGVGITGQPVGRGRVAQTVFLPRRPAQQISQLAQTSLRSVIGKLELDKTFEERDIINAQVVAAIDEAALNWGVKVLRYEIKDLTPPKEILHAMQSQITAEREKRALIAASEGRRQEQINIATGEREAFIARSEGEKQAAINKAQGDAAAITAMADATAHAIERIAAAIRQPGGEQAVQLKVAEQAVQAYSKVAAEAKTTLIIPGNMTEVSGLIASAMKMVSANKA